MNRGKLVAACSFLSLALLGPLGLPSRAAADAPAAPALLQNFDDQVAGDVPTSWIKLWGEQGDDQFTISNLKSVSGKNCLLLDKQSSTNTKMWGFGRPLPAMEEGWYMTSLDFAVEGAGNDISVWIELRARGGTNERVCVLGIAGQTVTMSSPDWTHSVVLGPLAPGTWNRVTLWTPTTHGGQASAFGLLENRVSDAWKAVGSKQSVPSAAPKGGYGFLEFNTTPDKRGYKLYVDDVQVSQAANVP